MKYLLLFALCGWFAWHTSAVRAADRKDVPLRAVIGPSDAQLAPYSPDPDHLWNRLHRGLFLRTAPDGSRRVHSTDPILYRYGTFLLEGESHSRAVALLDEFLSRPDDRDIDNPLKRLFLQRDLWAAFDYAAWYPDEWVHLSKHEPAAVALRTRLASGVVLPPLKLECRPGWVSIDLTGRLRNRVGDRNRRDVHWHETRIQTGGRQAHSGGLRRTLIPRSSARSS